VGHLSRTDLLAEAGGRRRALEVVPHVARLFAPRALWSDLRLLTCVPASGATWPWI
jgi:hypothetical protein